MKVKLYSTLTFVSLLSTCVFAMDSERQKLDESDEIPFSSNDFKDSKMLVNAIKRQLQKHNTVANQHNDNNGVLIAVARDLKNALDSDKKKLNSIKDKYGHSYTVLHSAASAKEIEVVKVLLDFPDEDAVQVLLETPNKYGSIPLHTAATYGQIEIAYLMLLKSNNPYYLLTKKNNSDNDSLAAAIIGTSTSGVQWKTTDFLRAALDAYYQGRDQALKSFLQNYVVTISQEPTCSCCTIL